MTDADVKTKGWHYILNIVQPRLARAICTS